MSSRRPLPWPLHREWYRPGDGISVRRLTNPEAMIRGLALGRFAGYGSWKSRLLMAGLGTALVAAISALGG